MVANSKINLISRENFLAELNALKSGFDKMEPELAETVKDSALGVEGYVVVWNTDISVGGPLERSGKGGTRTTPTLTLDEVKMLARTMALKNAAAGLPLGGAKSGIKANSNDPDFEKKYRCFVRMCKPFLHENGGIFGGFGFDIGSQPVHALWACDELQSTRSFTGKPLDMGGTDYDREGIAGLGVAVAAATTLDVFRVDPAKATFSVQGMGAMGAAVLRYFSETGARITCLSDPKYNGTWSFEKPISNELLSALINNDVAAAKVKLAAEGKNISEDPQDALYHDSDVLFPCAVQNVITEDNCDRIKARFISEGANGPSSEAAKSNLHKRGIRVIPDFIANPGGIIAAFVELTSKSESKAEEAKTLTRSKIADNVRKMWELVEQYDTEPQNAGMYMALKAIGIKA